MNVSSEKKSITLEAAGTMVDAAIQKARELGVSEAVAVVDADGVLKAFGRMDGAILLAVRLAQQKAWSALSFNSPTHELWEMMKDDPPLLASLPHQENMFAGGWRLPYHGRRRDHRRYRCQRRPLCQGPEMRRSRAGRSQLHMTAGIGKSRARRV